MNAWLPPFVYTFLMGRGQLRKPHEAERTCLYWMFWIAVPSDKLPMALPPDWLHQTDVSVSLWLSGYD